MCNCIEVPHDICQYIMETDLSAHVMSRVDDKTATPSFYVVPEQKVGK